MAQVYLRFPPLSKFMIMKYKRVSKPGFLNLVCYHPHGVLKSISVGAGKGHICGGQRFVHELSFVFLLFLSIMENEPSI